MRTPDSLADLVDQGIIDSVVRPLKSGKEANVYLVAVEGGHCVAKVYKELEYRTFKHRSAYTEGRKVRSTRDQRAMNKRTAYGQKKDDKAWRVAEVEAMYRLIDAGVRVPEPFHFDDGVLLMELIVDRTGEPARRLSEIQLGRAEAGAVFERLLAESVRMLCAGVVHGDLSEFNILMGADGPVIIDFPQWVDAALNQNARKLLIRDIENLTAFLRRFDPRIRRLPYGEELWQLFEKRELAPDTVLTGAYAAPVGDVDFASLAGEIRDAQEAFRLERAASPRRTKPKRGALRRSGQQDAARGSGRKDAPRSSGRSEAPGSSGRSEAPSSAGRGPAASQAPSKRRRRRRKGGRGASPDHTSTSDRAPSADRTSTRDRAGTGAAGTPAAEGKKVRKRRRRRRKKSGGEGGPPAEGLGGRDPRAARA